MRKYEANRNKTNAAECDDVLDDVTTYALLSTKHKGLDKICIAVVKSNTHILGGKKATIKTSVNMSGRLNTRVNRNACEERRYDCKLYQWSLPLKKAIQRNRT